VADVARGNFRVYAASTVDDLCRLMMRMPLGSPDARGEWPEGTLGRRVDERLQEMAESMRDFGKPDGA
jgi:hypothetical protein